MPQLDLFANETDDNRPDEARRLQPKLEPLAKRGIYFGTSSWKYPGWLGTIYQPENYQVRGRFSQRKFDDECLQEYAKTFSLVGGDFSFYQFPTPDFWSKLFRETPESLLFALKCPEELTVQRWPSHARYGVRAGEPNPGFLDPRLFRSQFLERLEPYRERVAVIMLEFGTFSKSTMPTPADFYDPLGQFLRQLPPGFRYAVEIRNPEFLQPDYFATLAESNVAHLFNAWTRMPTLPDQISLPDAFTADFIVSRALLTKGRLYDQAVQRFEPYDRIQEPNPTAREGLRDLAQQALQRKKPAFLLVNNRLEGHSPGTIEAVIDSL